MADNPSLLDRLQKRLAVRQSQQQILRLAREVNAYSQPLKNQNPVLLFNASTRIQGLSLNAAFQMLTGWSLRLSWVPTGMITQHHRPVKTVYHNQPASITAPTFARFDFRQILG